MPASELIFSECFSSLTNPQRGHRLSIMVHLLNSELFSRAFFCKPRKVDTDIFSVTKNPCSSYVGGWGGGGGSGGSGAGIDSTIRYMLKPTFRTNFLFSTARQKSGIPARLYVWAHRGGIICSRIMVRTKTTKKSSERIID